MSGRLPPPEPRDLPDPIPFRRMIGPSVILLGLSLGSGEYVLWPYLTVRYGFNVFWGALLGIVTQFFINMEIARYTLATGEGITTGFARLSRHFAWIFIVCIVAADMWPGWATGAGMALSYLIGGNPTVYAAGGLVVVGLILSLGPIIYRTVEATEWLLVGVIFATLVFASLWVVKAEAVWALGSGLLQFGHLPEGIDLALYLGALAYAGAGGPTNLAQSSYVKEKGYAMGRYVGRLVSPLTGREEPIAEVGFCFPETEENLSRWRSWWRAANLEHLLMFLLAGAAGMVLLALIAYSTLNDPSVPRDMGFIGVMADRFAAGIGGWFRALYLIMGVAVLFSTEIGIVDIIGRLVAEIVKVNYLRGRERPSESLLYLIIIWVVIAAGVGILLAGFREPVALLVMGAALSGMVMFLYSGLLLWMNFTLLPRSIRMSPLRLIALLWGFGFYGYFSLLLLADIPRQLFG